MHFYVDLLLVPSLAESLYPASREDASREDIQFLIVYAHMLFKHEE